MVDAAPERQRHPGLDIVIGGLEPQHEHRMDPVARSRELGLGGVDQAAVGRREVAQSSTSATSASSRG